ncbi:MAG: magnesium transporter MgtC, partial [Betaproteobacteria bacterium RIFCSPHIGHO2_12_FULL_69_13]
ALLGTLAAMIAERTENVWTVPVGLAAVAGMLIAAYAREERLEDPGTTTVVAAAVCYLLGVLAGMGEAALAGALAIGVTALLYFKPELEGLSASLKRQDQVSVLQFLVVTFIVLPILPDRGYGPYEVLNPRHIWLIVVLISGVGLAGYVALRIAGERHGVLITGALGGLVSSTATTVLYARRGAESEAMARVSLVVVLVANLVTLLRVMAIAAVVAPPAIGTLAPVLGAAFGAGLLATLASMRRLERGGPLPMPEIRNPTELGTALKFAAVYALVLLASAWLSNVAGDRGLYAVALATGLLDVDTPTLSALNLFNAGRAGVG